MLINKTIKKLIRNCKKSGSFQDKRGHSEKRWEMFSHSLPKVGSVLDMGCDEGILTDWCADHGLFSLGVDRSSHVIQLAKRRESFSKKLSFMCCNIDVDLIDSMPTFDCVLMLSVHHHFWRTGGRVYAEDVFRKILSKTDRIIYEAPIRTVRYRPKDKPSHEIPSFINLDKESAAEWYTEWIKTIVPRAKIEFLGYAPCLGEREPERPVFCVYSG